MKENIFKKTPKNVSQLFSVYGTLVLVIFLYSTSRSKEIPNISFTK